MKKDWFRNKKYGWGWLPNKWQGWFVTMTYVVVMMLNFYRIDHTSHSVSDTLTSFILQSTILTIILFSIAYIKGPKPRWQWGEVKIKDK